MQQQHDKRWCSPGRLFSVDSGQLSIGILKVDRFWFIRSLEAYELASAINMRDIVQFMLSLAGILNIKSVLASPALILPNLDAHHNSTSNARFNISSLGNPYQCYEPGLRKDRRANLLDCLKAAAFLPNLHEEGLFHRAHDPEDPFALPVILTVKTCRIKIDTRYGRSDISDWMVIYLALRKIFDACRTSLNGERTGGETTAGTAGLITITAESASWLLADPASVHSVGSVERL